MALTKDQSKHIQILRGLAIIAVVVIHNTPIGISQVLIRPFLNFSVGLFLFLSGLLSSRASYKPLKRITKVVVPYIFWTLVYTCMNNLYYLAAVPTAFIKSLVFGNGAAIMYYIFVYCEFTLLIPLIDKLANSKLRYLGFVIAPVEIILMRTLPVVMGYQNNYYVDLIVNVSCLGWFTYFYLGYLIGNKKVSVNYKNSTLIIALVASILLQMGEGYYYFTLGSTNCGSQLKLTSVLTGVVFALLAYKFIYSQKTYSCKPLCTLGDYSFGIYFSHLAVMHVLSMIPGYAGFVAYPINAIVALVASFAMCWLGKKILGKFSWIIAL